MTSVFTKIINGEIPAYKIMEDEMHLAFLDVNPLLEGHTLVIPKKEIDLIFDLESDEFKELFGFAQKVAQKVKSAISCKRVGIAVLGLEVPHAHIHLLPFQQLNDIDFSRERLNFSSEEYQKIQEKIVNA